jgi:hypothetical protein
MNRRQERARPRPSKSAEKGLFRVEYGRAIIVDDLRSEELRRSSSAIYDREIGLRLLYEDPDSGAEHYLIRYPAGLKTQLHRHTAAHTIVVLDGRLEVNDQVIGPGPTVTSRPERR